MEYKTTVARIVNLPWKLLNTNALLKVMALSYYAAREFASSLRLAVELDPDNASLRKLAHGELSTINLRFGGYCKLGDHWQFLEHFLREYGGMPVRGNIAQIGSAYMGLVGRMAPEIRAMSVFSREQELPAIFKQILEVREDYWKRHGALEAFRYYLERHIALDSEDGGHADLIHDMPIDDRVDEFYRIRLQLYEPIFPGLCRV